VRSLVLKELPPSGGDTAGHSDILVSTIRLDFHGIVFPVVRPDSLIDTIESECLCSCVLSPSLNDNIVGSNTFDNSLHWHP